MKNIFKIYIRDMKRVFTNWAAIIMALILILIPSLYSLTNIKSSWDPYGNTGGIKIAVVNKDEGTVYKEQDVKVGEELIEKLKDNDAMSWQFVSEKEAEDGLMHEKYYASIVIPEDFSQNVTTLMEKQVVKPKLIYTVNEKTNAIAPKLTDAGAQSVQSQLDENIIKTVTGIMFRIVNETGEHFDGKRNDIRYIIDKIYELDEEMPKLESILDDAISGTGDTKDLLAKTNDLLPTVSDILDSSNDFINNSDYIVDEIQNNVDEISPKIKEDLLLSQDLMNNASVTLGNLEENILPDAAKKSLIMVSETADSTKTTVVEVKGMLKSVQKFLKKIINYDIPEFNFDQSTEIENEDIKNIQDNLNAQKEFLEDIKNNLKKANKSIGVLIERLDDAEEKLDLLITRSNEKIEEIDNGTGLDLEVLTTLRSNIDDIDKIIGDVVSSYDSEIIDGIDDGLKSIKYILNMAVDILQQANDMLPDVEDILSSTQDTIDFAKSKLLDIKDKLPEVEDKVSEIADKLREMDDEDKFNEILDMVTNNWNEQSDFMADPIEIVDNRLFPWPNYGSSSAPFYVVLCIWVGALIASALMSLHADKFEEGVELRPYEVYLGKLMTFCTFTIAGAVVACIGALYWLEAYAVHPLKFILFGAFLAVVFTTIIYTAASLLDDVGKAGIVVIMVLQIAGTSGTFPIEVTPTFFHKIMDYLPFTYAISGMRQIMAGIVYPILIKDIKMLSIYLVVSLIMGIVLKGPMNKLTDKMSEKLISSGVLRH